MTPKFTTIERLVGLFILLAFLSFLTTIILVGRGQHWFKAYNIYSAVYKEGYNIQPGVKVRFLGTDIGLVTAVALDDFNRARVTMRILAEYASRITTDSVAAIESPTIIGSEYINIIPGSQFEPSIPAGGLIPSREAKKIGDYLEDYKFDNKMKRLDEILTNLADLTDQLRKPDGPLIGTLDHIEKMANTVAKGEGTIGKIVKQDDMYKKIMEELEALTRILATIQQAANSIRDSAKSIKTGATSVKKGAKSVEVATSEIEAKLPDILNKVQSVTRDLEKAMTEVPDISQKARKGMRDVNDILESVKRNILIRGNLPAPATPQSHGLEIRGD